MCAFPLVPAAGETLSEGGFAPNRVSAASLLDVKTEKDKKGKAYYVYEILTRTGESTCSSPGMQIGQHSTAQLGCRQDCCDVHLQASAPGAAPDAAVPCAGTDVRAALLLCARPAADGDEGGRHQLIKATVSNGTLYVLKVQAGDKRWFKGTNKECLGVPNSFTVA